MTVHTHTNLRAVLQKASELGIAPDMNHPLGSVYSVIEAVAEKDPGNKTAVALRDESKARLEKHFGKDKA